MHQTLERLQTWYLSQCDGDWEHGYGVSIRTLDNPGWAVKVALEGTNLGSKAFDEVRDRYESENDWVICRVIEGRFEGFCGPKRLADVLETFLDWAEG